MAVIDHYEALQWNADWGIPSSRAKSFEPLHGLYFTSTFVIFSLAGVRLFRGRSAFISFVVLTVPVWSRHRSKQQGLEALDLNHTARVRTRQYQLKEQLLRACDSVSSRKLHYHSITPQSRCALCVYSRSRKERSHM
jgi:hypothetical protein